MNVLEGRYQSSIKSDLTNDWLLERLTPPSRLFGANGLRTGSDGRIYVAQVAGSQISAIAIDSGEIEVVSPMGSGIVGPDDLVFDDEGNLFATEITEGRVSKLKPNGEYQVIYSDMTCANPITFHQGRLFAGELLPSGRIMELNRDGGLKRVILENVPLPNAFEVGPDGFLYFPVQGTNEIWRVHPDGGTPEVVATGLGIPDSVKFDAKGFIISTQVASGQVFRIDPRSGEKTLLADIGPGLDNCTFVGDRLFVSSISGEINEITHTGEVKPLIPDGLQWPMGLAIDDNDVLFIADGGFTYIRTADGKRQLAGMLYSPGFPGFTRGVIASKPGEWIVTTAMGTIARFRPHLQQSDIIASGLEQPMDLARTANGALLTVEYEKGTLLSITENSTTQLASDLNYPIGVAVDAGDTCYVSEAGANRVIKITGNQIDTVIDNLQRPEGIAVHQGKLYVVDTLDRTLIELDLESLDYKAIASGLPVGSPPSSVRPQLGGVGDMCGPMTAFTGITVGNDGTVYLSADAEGSVLALRRA